MSTIVLKIGSLYELGTICVFYVLNVYPHIPVMGYRSILV